MHDSRLTTFRPTCVALVDCEQHWAARTVVERNKFTDKGVGTAWNPNLGQPTDLDVAIPDLAMYFRTHSFVRLEATSSQNSRQICQVGDVIDPYRVRPLSHSHPRSCAKPVHDLSGRRLIASALRHSNFETTIACETMPCGERLTANYNIRRVLFATLSFLQATRSVDIASAQDLTEPAGASRQTGPESREHW